MMLCLKANESFDTTLHLRAPPLPPALNANNKQMLLSEQPSH
jgi:hypothetical protein